MSEMFWFVNHSGEGTQNLVPEASVYSEFRLMGSFRLRVVKFLNWKQGSCCKMYSTHSHCGRHCWPSWACRQPRRLFLELWRGMWKKVSRQVELYIQTYLVVKTGYWKTSPKKLLICRLCSSSYFIKTTDLVYKCAHNVHCFCVKLSLTPACALLSI